MKKLFTENRNAIFLLFLGSFITFFFTWASKKVSFAPEVSPRIIYDNSTHQSVVANDSIKPPMMNQQQSTTGKNQIINGNNDAGRDKITNNYYKKVDSSKTDNSTNGIVLKNPVFNEQPHQRHVNVEELKKELPFIAPDKNRHIDISYVLDNFESENLANELDQTLTGLGYHIDGFIKFVPGNEKFDKEKFSVIDNKKNLELRVNPIGAAQ